MSTFKVGDLIKATGNGDERALRTETQLTGSNVVKIIKANDREIGPGSSSIMFTLQEADLNRANGVYFVWASDTQRRSFRLEKRERIEGERIDTGTRRFFTPDNPSVGSNFTAGSTSIFSFTGNTVQIYVENTSEEPFEMNDFYAVLTLRQGELLFANEQY